MFLIFKFHNFLRLASQRSKRKNLLKLSRNARIINIVLVNMSSCSAAEIAEKKRIALEKLKARKANLNASNNNKTSIPAQLASVVVPPPTSTSVSATSTENKASSFLNALKGSNVFKHRQEPQHAARDAAHPYKRPSFGDASSFYKKKTSVEVADRSSGPQFGMGQQTKNVAPVFHNSVSCKVAMISAGRFEVQPSSYHNKLIEVFKTIPSKNYGKFGLQNRLTLNNNTNFLITH